jgi:RNA polymerase sigma factor (sigma-70 family)
MESRRKTGGAGLCLLNNPQALAVSHVAGPPDAMQSRQLDLFYRQHARWLRDRLSRRYGPDLAEDLVQEAYLRLPPEPVRCPKAFLLTAAINIALDHFRSVARAGRRDRQAMRLSYGDVGQGVCAMHAADQEANVLLTEIVLKLPPLYRDVFVLSRAGNLTYEAIALRLGVPLKTVEWRMSKALAMCAVLMREGA